MSSSAHTVMPIYIVVILVFVGVVLPAVWSARPERRCAAAGVLRLLVRGVVDIVRVLRAP